MDYGGIAFFIWVQCPAPTGLSAYLPVSGLLVPILVSTQEIQSATYVASHIVGHNALESPQANEALPPPEDPFLCTKHLGEIV